MTITLGVDKFGLLTATLAVSGTSMTLDTNVGLTSSRFKLTDPVNPNGQKEWVQFTGVTDNGDGTYTYTGLTRQLSTTGTPTSQGNGYTWGIGCVATIVAMQDMFQTGSVSSVSVGNGLSVTNPTTTPSISLLDTVSTVTGNTTLALTDAGKTIYCDSSSTITITIPANSSVPFPIGTQIDFSREGTGSVVFSITTDELHSVSDNFYIANRYNGVTLKKKDTTKWRLYGTLSAS